MSYSDPQAQRDYQRKWVARRRAEWFADKVCFHCGSTENLTIDHLDPSTKKSNSIWSWSEVRRNAELEKCQVLCRPCHLWKTLGCGEYACGERNARAKLSEVEVLILRKRVRSGEQVKTVAAAMGIPYWGACSAASGRTWRHLNDE